MFHNWYDVSASTGLHLFRGWFEYLFLRQFPGSDEKRTFLPGGDGSAAAHRQRWDS